MKDIERVIQERDDRAERLYPGVWSCPCAVIRAAIEQIRRERRRHWGFYGWGLKQGIFREDKEA